MDLITGPKLGGGGGVSGGSAKSPNLTFFFEAFPYPTKLAITLNSEVPSRTAYKDRNFAKIFLYLSLLKIRENNFCAIYRFNLITFGVEKIQQLICFCYKSS